MAEEKKIASGQQKLTYEQLKAYAQQTTDQANRLYQENQMLKKALTEANIGNNLREVECVLKCLDHAELFPKDFIDSIINRLVDVLTPREEEETKEEEK